MVQALYQMELSGQASESAIDEFIEHRIGQEIEGEQYVQADHKYFANLIRGVIERQDEIDQALARATGKSWSYDRIDAIMRAIMRASSCEFLSNGSVPVRVIIDEYLTVAGAFYSDRSDEMIFLSGVLYRMAREFRPSDAATLDPAAS